MTDPGDLDLFTAIVSGLTHQQVANDPGGDRWVGVARRVVDMFLGEVARQRSSTRSTTNATTTTRPSRRKATP